MLYRHTNVSLGCSACMHQKHTQTSAHSTNHLSQHRSKEHTHARTHARTHTRTHTHTHTHAHTHTHTQRKTHTHKEKHTHCSMLKASKKIQVATELGPLAGKTNFWWAQTGRHSGSDITHSDKGASQEMRSSATTYIHVHYYVW